MRIQQLTLLSAAALALSTAPSIAGPCSQGIDQMQAQINARLMAPDNTGRVAPESSAATMHRRPTPDMEEERLGDAAMAAAEAELGEVSSQAVQTVAAAMVRARAADLAGDQSGKGRTKVKFAPRKAAKSTSARASAKKAAHRVAVKTKTKAKKQAIKPRARRAAPKKAVPQPTELAGRLAEATDEAAIVDIIEEPVAGAVVVTEFESVRTSGSEAPGPQHEGKDSSELGEHLH